MYQQTLQPEIPQLPGDPGPAAEHERGLDLLDIVLVFARRKWLLLGFMLAGGLALLIYALTQPKLYEADAVIMPPQEQQSSSALMGQLGLLSGLAGGMKSPSDLYIGLLGSRTVRERIAKDYKLNEVYKCGRVDIAGAILGSRTKLTSGKDGLITIKVRDKDAKRSAALADDYASALFALNSNLAIGQAAQRRVFFDQQLEEEKNKLANAEVALQQQEEKSGVIQLQGQTSVIISQIAQLRANITSKQVQLSSLRASSTDEAPEVVRTRSELAGLQQELRAMEGRAGIKDGDDLGLSSKQVPGVGLEYIRRERDVQYHQTLYELLARQLEAARIDEAKAAPIVQLLDPAEVPFITTYPKTKLLIIFGMAAGLVLGVIWCVLLYIYEYIQEDPRLHGKLWAVKAALVGRKW